jgi:hypothetical protein
MKKNISFWFVILFFITNINFMNAQYLYLTGVNVTSPSMCPTGTTTVVNGNIEFHYKNDGGGWNGGPGAGWSHTFTLPPGLKFATSLPVTSCCTLFTGVPNVTRNSDTQITVGGPDLTFGVTFGWFRIVGAIEGTAIGSYTGGNASNFNLVGNNLGGGSISGSVGVSGPYAGTSSTGIACTATSSFDLLNAINNENSGGTWSYISGPQNILPSGSIVSFAGASTGNYVFRYSATSTSPCPISTTTSDATITVSQASFAGTSGLGNANCRTNNFDLFPAISGETTGGVWSFVSGPQTITPVSNLVSFGGKSIGTYVFQYNVAATANCPASSANATINVVESSGAPFPAGCY